MFEIVLIIMFMLVLAVIGAAAGQIARDEWGLSEAWGAGLMLSLVVVLLFFGRQMVTLILAYWSFYLFAVLAIYLVVVGVHLDLAPTLKTEGDSPHGEIALSALQYTFYN